MRPHQYVQRASGAVCSEALLGDRWVQWLYGPAREKAPVLFKALTSARASQLLSYFCFDAPYYHRPAAARRIARTLGIDLSECLTPAAALTSARALFERQIRYWQCRPMPAAAERVVSPADAKMLAGSLREISLIYLKEKFFTYSELLGAWQSRWLESFRGGSFAVFRLTPEKYHYNHLPVSGRVSDCYAIEGDHHACNPAAVVSAATPYSKNRRVVTIIDTDVPGGTQVGHVAMIEIAALMIGVIEQCYSAQAYADPRPVRPGMFVRRGQPKSLFRPGSSVVVLLFQKQRMAFDTDLAANRLRRDVHSRYNLGFHTPLVETDVRVRTAIGQRLVHTGG
jgi:phosphatidylserine decarboxylase